MTQKEFNLWLIGGALLLVLFSIFAIDDIYEDAAEDAAYCGMVKDFKESNGKHGWPAYKGEEVCNET
jgi:hypothetical protein